MAASQFLLNSSLSIGGKVANQLGRKPASRKLGALVPISVQLAFARQDAKEQEKSDDDWRRSDDSYSPRRHWRFRSPTISVGPGLRTDV